jgi:hypothetical protein
LLPPGFTTHEGQEVGQNAVQRWLWSCWTDAWDVWLPSVVGDAPWAMVVNGDAIDGNHHGTKQIIGPDEKDHGAMAFQCLEPLVKRASKTYVVEGTESHTKNSEHTLAKDLKAERDPDTSKPAWQRLSLTVNGTRCVFAHHVSTSARMYLRASALSIYLANEQLEAVNNGEEIPKVCGFAHRHTFDSYERSNGLAFVTPAWQVLTRYGLKVVPSARCKPGIVVLDFRGREAGELPRLHARTYNAPHAKGATL